MNYFGDNDKKTQIRPYLRQTLCLLAVKSSLGEGYNFAGER